MKLDNIKVVIPIPVISDALFDKDVRKTPEDNTSQYVQNDEIDKINEDARKEYKEAHPTVKEFIEGK